ncbi:MAG: cytidine deaminase [Gemmatimonadales bacterium]|jgi:cytidine deaminase|nr:cytidine deaminase [Gemmatimonadales bacterium]HEV7594931.1 cytidine deaminase [Gemmatimonadaceae bacterium]
MATKSEKKASLREAAMRALDNAHAPYSNFKVGAALRTRDGRLITGCNVENSAYGLAICAETLAVASAVSQGLTEFDEIAIASDDSEPTPPCGACRQVLNEFAPNIRVSSYTRDGKEASWTLQELLPHAFVLNQSRGRM